MKSNSNSKLHSYSDLLFCKRTLIKLKWKPRSILIITLIISSILVLFQFSSNSYVLSENDPQSTLNKTFIERLELLNEVCKKYSHPLRAESQALLHLPIDEPRFYSTINPKFSMCMIPKVASTSLSTFLVRAHQSEKNKLGLENLMKPIPFLPHLGDSFKVLVVRHPFERLLSAFSYIFGYEIDNDPESNRLFSVLARKLVTKYRNVSLTTDQTKVKENRVTFKEFIRYVLRGGEDFSEESDPTVQDDNLNGHWLPYWKLCTPCQQVSKPDLIIKLGEGMQKEMLHMIKVSHLQDVLQLDNFPWLNPAQKNGKNSKGLAKEFFSQLTQAEILELYHKYRIDHEMFAYSIQPFLSYAKTEL